MDLNGFLLIAAVVALEVSLIALVVIALNRFLPDRLVAARHNLALAAFLLIPVLFIFASQPGKPKPQQPEPVLLNRVTTAQPQGFGGEPIQIAPVNERAVSSQSFETATIAPISFTNIALTIWAIGTGLMLLRLAGDLVQLQSLRSRSVVAHLPASLRLSRRITARRSADIDAPMVVGFFRPVILLPMDFDVHFRAHGVLEHEIAHIRRGDAWAELGLRLVLAAFWWIAPLYLLHKIIRQTRETLCDARAATVTGAPAELAHALLDAAARVTRVPAMALSASPTRPNLSTRIEYLTSNNTPSGRTPLMRLHVILPTMAIFGLIVTPQLGEAREIDEKKLIFSQLEDDDQLAVGDSSERVYVYSGDKDLDLEELEARLSEIDFAELEARLNEMEIEIEAKMADIDFSEFEARMDALDFSEFEAKMEAMEAEIEARVAEMDFSAMEAEIEAKIEAMDFEALEAQIEAKLSEIDFAQLEKLAELEELSQLKALSRLEDLSRLENLKNLKVVRVPPAPPAPAAMPELSREQALEKMEQEFYERNPDYRRDE
ncbi:MAG: hypothetical protein CMK07_14845 [Ponticaulis sp.]|nr:hypothetical protein [Ponticaulis sp.]